MGKLNLEMDTHDIAMLFGLVLIGRRYGDLETSNWAGELRERVRVLLKADEGPDGVDEPVSIKLT